MPDKRRCLDYCRTSTRYKSSIRCNSDAIVREPCGKAAIARMRAICLASHLTSAPTMHSMLAVDAAPCYQSPNVRSSELTSRGERPLASQDLAGCSHSALERAGDGSTLAARSGGFTREPYHAIDG
jgi:hypothetical protein